MSNQIQLFKVPVASYPIKSELQGNILSFIKKYLGFIARHLEFNVSYDWRPYKL